MEILSKMKEEINRAYSYGYHGKPCDIFPRLTAETKESCLEEKAEKLVVRLSFDDKTAAESMKNFFIAFMKSWQKGARAANPIPPGG